MNRITVKFNKLKRDAKKALIAYLMSGFPSIEITERLVLELEKRGVDIIELGAPFSDPLADGSIIQSASNYALKNKVNLDTVFSLAARIRKKSQIPICLMGYYNPILSLGDSRFVEEASRAGIDGVIIPDLPPEEAGGLIAASKKKDLKTVFFLSPTSVLERIKFISRISSGFIYYVSLTGVTGERDVLSSDLTSNIKLIKKYTDKPICAGFGISKPEHIREVFKVADGAIVGSAIIKAIQNNIGRKDLVEKVGDFVEGLVK